MGPTVSGYILASIFLIIASSSQGDTGQRASSIKKVSHQLNGRKDRAGIKAGTTTLRAGVADLMIVHMTIKAKSATQIGAEAWTTTPRGIKPGATMLRGQVIETSIIQKGIKVGTTMPSDIEARTTTPKD
jgi:hypothetical protein